jgi:hypothetical protein
VRELCVQLFELSTNFPFILWLFIVRPILKLQSVFSPMLPKNCLHYTLSIFFLFFSS